MSISRRDLIKSGAVIAAGLAATGGLAACTTKEAADTSWLPEKWDYEADVVVLGFGAGGSAASIEAADAGASVILLEKNAQGGGAIIESGGVIYAGGGTALQKAEGIEDTPEDMYNYLMAVKGDLGDPEIIRAYVDKSVELIDWVVGLDFDLRYIYVSGAEKEYESVAKVAARGHTSVSEGRGLFKNLEDAIAARENIQVMLNTRAMAFVANPVTKEVVGVKATSNDQTIYVRANKGVIACTGSMSWNRDKLSIYLPTWRDAWTLMPPGLEGDGLTMCQRLGVELCNIGLTPTITPGLPSASTDRELPFADVFINFNLSPKGPGIFVNKQAKRFVNETLFYGITQPAVAAQDGGMCYCIFDEDGRTATGTGSELTLYRYQSKDYENEIAKGTVKKAETIEELAALVGIDGAVLQETINTWNENVENGSDPDFGKTDWLWPIKKAPFYIAETRPTLADAICGIKVNKEAEIIDVDGNAIPRLYGAGTMCGGWSGVMYAGSGVFVGNAFVLGRTGAQNVVALEPWVEEEV